MANLDLELVKQIRDNPRLRQRLAYEDPLWFSLLYLHDHFTSPLAPFHQEIFHLMREPCGQWTVVMAFRESGKSTLLNLVNTLWSILGAPQKRFVLIMSKTSVQASSHFTNIKDELTRNTLLREDFGPFTDRESEWNRTSLEMVYHDAKIQSVTFDHSIRGLKHGRYRPDLIICDDVEDASDADRERTREIMDRFDQEIIPAGTDGTHIVVLGNLLGEDSLLVELERRIVAKRLQGIFRAYPLIDTRSKCLWPAKFNREVLQRLRAGVSSGTWEREYLLHASSNSGRDSPNPKFDKMVERLKVTPEYNLLEKVEGPLQAPFVTHMQKFKIRTPSGSEILHNDPVYKERIQKLADLLVKDLKDEWCG